MDSHQHAALSRMFNDPRGLHPWEPEHALFIAGELAKLKITAPEDYKSKKAFYDQKMKEWEGTPDDPVDVRDTVPQHTNFNHLPLPEFPPEVKAVHEKVVKEEKPKEIVAPKVEKPVKKHK